MSICKNIRAMIHESTQFVQVSSSSPQVVLSSLTLSCVISSTVISAANKEVKKFQGCLVLGLNLRIA